MPPYWLRQRWKVCSEISRCRATSSTLLPWAKSLSPSASLRITCSGVCRRLLHLCCPPCPILRHRTRTAGGSVQGDPVKVSNLMFKWRRRSRSTWTPEPPERFRCPADRPRLMKHSTHETFGKGVGRGLGPERRAGEVQIESPGLRLCHRARIGLHRSQAMARQLRC